MKCLSLLDFALTATWRRSGSANEDRHQDRQSNRHIIAHNYEHHEFILLIYLYINSFNTITKTGIITITYPPERARA